MKTIRHVLSYLPLFFLEWEMFQTRTVQEIRKNILWSLTVFFPKIVAFFVIIWKNILERGRPQMTIWRMRIACWIPKATNTHPGFVIIFTFPLRTKVLQLYVISTLPVYFQINYIAGSHTPPYFFAVNFNTKFMSNPKGHNLLLYMPRARDGPKRLPI